MDLKAIWSQLIKMVRTTNQGANVMRYKKTDGGRLDAGFKGRGGDCVVRAIAIATNEPYIRVRRGLAELSSEMTGGLETSAANGVARPVSHTWLSNLGWETVITKKSYLSDIPLKGIYIASLPRHYVAVVNGVIHDTWDSSVSMKTKCGSPVMEGYYQKEQAP
jgi:hypothetical protein